MARYLRCEQYDTFFERFGDLRSKNSALNKVIRTGSKSQQRSEQECQDLQMVYYRSAIISILATWEAYVQDLFEEVKDIIVESIINSDVHDISRSWKSALVKEAIEMEVKKTSKKEEKTHKKDVDLCMQLIQDPQHWKTLVDTYMKKKVDTAIRLKPMFKGSKGIDKKFQALLGMDSECVLSDVIMEKVLSHSFIVGYKEEKQLVLKTPDDLDNLLRLYYGARCVFAHGQSEQSFEEEGVLHGFPIEKLSTMVGDEKVAGRLRSLHDNLKKHGNSAWVYHTTIVNMQRFIIYLAQRLFRAVSKCIFKKFQLTIWGYNPTMDEGEEGLLRQLSRFESQDDASEVDYD